MIKQVAEWKAEITGSPLGAGKQNVEQLVLDDKLVSSSSSDITINSSSPASQRKSTLDLKKDILMLIAKIPGIDSEEVALRLGIDDGLAWDLTRELLREGILRI